jgi:hypothetical protein|nr:MAG TPA: hypothetical protein [Caudoviricetes sp.]
MIADKPSDKEWYGNGKPDASQGGNPNGGVASETQGREDKSELYENDVIGKVAKRKKNDIWTRGGEKRTRFKDE